MNTLPVTYGPAFLMLPSSWCAIVVACSIALNPNKYNFMVDAK
jgi:hypothetical protein